MVSPSVFTIGRGNVPPTQFENGITLDEVLPWVFVRVTVTASMVDESPSTKNDCMNKNELPKGAAAELPYQFPNSVSTFRAILTDCIPSGVLTLNTKLTSCTRRSGE